jgi:hypothetical protein
MSYLSMRKHGAVKDVNQMAASIRRQTTGEPEKNPHAVAMARRRAEKLGPERRREIASAAAKQRWATKKK